MLGGTLLYEKNEQCLVSVSTSKNNGVLYFAKKMTIAELLERSKEGVSTGKKVKMSVKMFHKVLYGRILNKPKGCYANW